MKLSRRTWQGIALLLFLFALSFVACGLLLYVVPMEQSLGMPYPEGYNSQLIRGLCLAPAFTLVFLAYLAFWVGRQKDHSVHWSELVPALGVAGGMVIALVGFAAVGSPLPGDPVEMRAGMALCFFLPGMGIMALSALFWWWSRGRFAVSERSIDTLVASLVEDDEMAEAERDSRVLK